MMPAVSGENPRLRVLSIEEFIDRVKPIFEVENFWERESGRKSDLVGRFAHVLSEYDSCATRKAHRLRAAPIACSSTTTGSVGGS